MPEPCMWLRQAQEESGILPTPLLLRPACLPCTCKHVACKYMARAVCQLALPSSSAYSASCTARVDTTGVRAMNRAQAREQQPHLGIKAEPPHSGVPRLLLQAREVAAARVHARRGAGFEAGCLKALGHQSLCQACGGPLPRPATHSTLNVCINYQRRDQKKGLYLPAPLNH